MAKYKVKFLQSALNDLEEIVLYIAADSKDRALKWHDYLIEKANNLALFPNRGISVPDRKLAHLDYRMFLVGNHIIFYKVYEKNKEVIILRILDAKRDYPQFFKNYVVKKD